MPDGESRYRESRDWDSEKRSREERLQAGSKFARGKMVKPADTTRPSSGRATGSAWRATTRSRPTSWPSAWREKLELELASVMIYGDDLTHIVSEEGHGNLLLCRDSR